MSQDGNSRRLIRHGMVLFLLGLVTGILIPTLTSPRLALAAHMEALLNGIFLILLGGVVWKQLRLPERLAAAGFWLLLIAAYANWGFCLLAAVFGASQVLAIAGAGYGAMWLMNRKGEGTLTRHEQRLHTLTSEWEEVIIGPESAREIPAFLQKWPNF